MYVPFGAKKLEILATNDCILFDKNKKSMSHSLEGMRR